MNMSLCGHFGPCGVVGAAPSEPTGDAHEGGPAPKAIGGAGEDRTRAHPTGEAAAPSISETPLMTIESVRRELACSRHRLERAHAAGRFPEPDAWIGRRPRWRRETLTRWIAGGGR